MEIVAIWLFAALMTGLVNLLICRIIVAGIWGFIRPFDTLDYSVALGSGFGLPIISPFIWLIIGRRELRSGWRVLQEFRKYEDRSGW